MKKATFLEALRYAEGWQALQTLCRQDCRGQWRMGQATWGGNPGGQTRQEERSLGWPQSLGPNSVRAYDSSFVGWSCLILRWSWEVSGTYPFPR